MAVDPKPYTGPERRRDTVRRRLVSEMDLEELRRTVLSDELTGLRNRRAFNERETGQGDVILLMDVDSLKWVNDSLGHSAGDALLRLVAGVLERLAQDDGQATAYRLAGDEFALVVRPMAQEPENRWVRIWSRLERLPYFWSEWHDESGAAWRMEGATVTFGIGECLDSADVALRQEKAVRQEKGIRAVRGERPKSFRVRSVVDEK